MRKLFLHTLGLTTLFLLSTFAFISFADVLSPPKKEYRGTETEIVDQLVADSSLHTFLKGGDIEHRLWDGTRVDVLTSEYAIEADWATKWAEAIGQSLYYAEITGRKPGIILLLKDKDKDQKYIYRCQTIAQKYDIRVWLIKTTDRTQLILPPGTEQ